MAFLIKAAKVAKKFARAKYSKFEVGAALQTKDGQVFVGCNVESSSYGLTVCAERVALFKALSEGADDFLRLAIVTNSKTPTSPCGACRQLLFDYAPGIEIILAGNDGEPIIINSEELYPRPFGDHDL
ncbi:cytidine deaminase [candidate division LCP-89 bacterium B3_LCP]|uniref:Cytidine deaminase n=1 Tax=candidate division LCP-89 bacterium B3_LCP TaxID=2012998 RepID=A0A532UYW7_UNCL8|nr:MAG: cytidine deaminase [candidate division LCP-89 bacterium B3_LCP]